MAYLDTLVSLSLGIGAAVNGYNFIYLSLINEKPKKAALSFSALVLLSLSSLISIH